MPTKIWMEFLYTVLCWIRLGTSYLTWVSTPLVVKITKQELHNYFQVEPSVSLFPFFLFFRDEAIMSIRFMLSQNSQISSEYRDCNMVIFVHTPNIIKNSIKGQY